MAENRVAIVTGGSSGIGAAAARALAGDGFRVAVMSPSDRSLALGKELDGIGRQGSNLNAGDVTDLVKQTLDAWGRIDAVVTSMGHGKVPKGPAWPLSKIGFDADNPVSLLDIGDDAWNAAFDAYVLSVVRMARAVTPHMVTRGGGAFVNISSIAAVEPQGNFPLSSVRAALHGFTKLFADRYAKYNLRMNNIVPGFVDNIDLTDAAVAEIPMQRPARMSEIGDAVLFLASEKSTYITGQSLLLDGGLHRALR